MRRVLGFLYMTVGTVVLSLTALFISLLHPRGDVVHRMARFWAKIYLLIGGVTVSLVNGEKIENPPYIFMSNHQSALDIFALLAGLPLSFRFIAKQELFRIPFFGWAMTRAGYISLDRDHPREAVKALDDAANKIRKGLNIVMFPEGTRSEDGQLLPFKKGSFTLALKASVPIIPLGIQGTNLLQPKGAFLPAGKGRVVLVVGDPVPTAGLGRKEKDGLVERVRGDLEGLTACQKT